MHKLNIDIGGAAQVGLFLFRRIVAVALAEGCDRLFWRNDAEHIGAHKGTSCIFQFPIVNSAVREITNAVTNIALTNRSGAQGELVLRIDELEARAHVSLDVDSGTTEVTIRFEGIDDDIRAAARRLSTILADDATPLFVDIGVNQMRE